MSDELYTLVDLWPDGRCVVADGGKRYDPRYRREGVATPGQLERLTALLDEIVGAPPAAINHDGLALIRRLIDERRAGAFVDLAPPDHLPPRTRPRYTLTNLLAQCDSSAPLPEGDADQAASGPAAARRCTYRVTWSPEDREYVATCAEFPSLSWLDRDEIVALRGLRALVSDAVADTGGHT